MKTAEFLRSNATWLGAGALLTFLSSFGQTFFISLFAGHIITDFGLTDGEWGLIYGLGTMISAAIMVQAGALTDILRIRHIGVYVLCGLILACLAMSLNTNTVGLVLVVLLLRFFGQGMSSHVAVVAMSRWFVATRGRALAVCTLGFTVGEFLFPVGIVALLDLVDWRLIWIAAAGVTALGIPLLLKLLRQERHPQHSAQETDSAGMDDRHWTRAEVLKHPLFWALVPALLGPAAFNTAFFFHQVHFAEVKGWSHLELVVFFPAYTVLGVVAMMISGWAVDRFGVARTMPFFQLPMVIGFLFFALGNSRAELMVGLTFMALTTGSNATIPNAFWAEFFGTRHIGSIKAMAAAVMVLGSALGPWITGSGIDLGLTLTTQYVWVAGYFLIATACMWAGVRNYRPLVPSYRRFLR